MSFPINPKRGEVWNIQFDPQVGAEIQKIRPSVVISIAGAGRLPLHIIVPITEGQVHFKNYFWMVLITATTSNGLTKDSFADAFQVKSVALQRFVSQRGILSPEQLDEIAAAIVLCVGYNPP